MGLIYLADFFIWQIRTRGRDGDERDKADRPVLRREAAIDRRRGAQAPDASLFACSPAPSTRRLEGVGLPNHNFRDCNPPPQTSTPPPSTTRLCPVAKPCRIRNI
jgi:hypothetical protein